MGPRILLIGAGALGGEIAMLLPQELAYRNLKPEILHIVDDDVIEISNLHRQCLLSPEDVGRFKALVVSERLASRFPLFPVSFDTKRVESLDLMFLLSFDIVFCAVDTLRSRRWINWLLVSGDTFAENINMNDRVKSTANSLFELKGPSGVTGQISSSSSSSCASRRRTLLIEGGTFGVMGHSRVIRDKSDACIECYIDLYSKEKFDHIIPLCTLTGDPKSAKDCVAWADWQSTNADDESEVLHLAIQRAKKFNISLEKIKDVLSLRKNGLIQFVPAVCTSTGAVAAWMVHTGGSCLSTFHSPISDSKCPDDFPVNNFWFLNMGHFSSVPHHGYVSPEESVKHLKPSFQGNLSDQNEIIGGAEENRCTDVHFQGFLLVPNPQCTCGC